jgi:hypothetical protein
LQNLCIAMKRSTSLGILACALLVASVGCTQVLGLDPPHRDPCADGDCTDASTALASEDPPDASPGTSVPSVIDASHEAAPDASRPDARVEARLIRCGGNGANLTFCAQATQTCCALPNDDGTFLFGCVDLSQKCPGVPIGCAKQADCDAPSICCVADTFQSCVTHGTCNGDIVCDPSSPTAECVAPQTCLPYPNPAVPYYFCQ